MFDTSIHSIPTNVTAQTNASALALPLIERLISAVVAENDDIRHRRRTDHRDYNFQKSQGLLELNRLGLLLTSPVDNPALGKALIHLRAVLTDNHRLLSVQLEAAKKVSDIVARAIRDGQSDGTYSAQSWRDWQ